jgi:NAD(P) transhydrogenase subunit alpha
MRTEAPVRRFGGLPSARMIRLHVPAGLRPGERRVPLLPDQLGRFAALGLDVGVERGAGAGAFATDEAYVAAGATLVGPEERAQADIVLSLEGVPEGGAWRRGAFLVGLLLEGTDRARLQTLAAAGVDAYALELLPRVSRAQTMDVLSSQATCAGYHGALLAAAHHRAFFPMMTTAFGTLKPARVLVLGAGVAGLSALAAVRRLGAEAWGYDVRQAAREQVESLGARFLDLGIDASTPEGYARPLTAEEIRRQDEALLERLPGMDVVITTALLAGRRAPVLLEERHVDALPPGSLVVDLAVDGGGNCRLSRPDEIVVRGTVRILAPRRPAAGVARHASAMLGRNFLAFLALLVREGTLKPEEDEPLLRATALTRGGTVVHPAFAEDRP